MGISNNVALANEFRFALAPNLDHLLWTCWNRPISEAKEVMYLKFVCIRI